MVVLISSHADGQLLESLIRRLGMGAVQGSSTRGGVKAVRELCREDSPWRHIAVTPDGPRGPRRVVQPGLVYIASRTGMAIRPVGVAYGRCWRTKSWDQFAIPKPWTKGVSILGPHIFVPPDLPAEGLEEYRIRVQTEMDKATATAQLWMDTGVFPKHPPDITQYPRLAS
jgi:hypothetical protein